MTKFTVTTRAAEFAKLWGVEDLSVAAMEDMERWEVDPKEPLDLMFHTFFVGPIKDNKAFVITPLRDNSGFLIDVAIFEDTGRELEKGPFKGYSVSIPSGVTPEGEE